VVIAMTGKPLGVAFVMNDGKMIGLICEGDIRRALQSGKSLEELTASDMMSRQPITVFEDLKLEEALQLMEDRPHPLNVLPVLKRDGSLFGLFRLHDAYGR
jgi:arabinose-5-phosphate isomerase